MYFHCTDHKFRQTGEVQKSVTCCHCGQVFTYVMTRTAEGKAISPYGIDQDSANLVARERAAANLRRMLETGCDPIPCPNCESLQPDMVLRLRYRYGRWIYQAAAVLFTVGVLFGFFGTGIAIGDGRGPRQAAEHQASVVLWLTACMMAVAVLTVPARIIVARIKYPYPLSETKFAETPSTSDKPYVPGNVTITPPRPG